MHHRQFFVDLGALSAYLAFESRNPLVREWEKWIRKDTFEQIDTPFGLMECWLELVNVKNGTVRFVAHNVFKSTGEDVVVSSQLRFRHKAELDASLFNAGFTIKHIYGNWHREPFTETSRLMVFIAQRN